MRNKAKKEYARKSEVNGLGSVCSLVVKCILRVDDMVLGLINRVGGVDSSSRGIVLYSWLEYKGGKMTVVSSDI